MLEPLCTYINVNSYTPDDTFTDNCSVLATLMKDQMSNLT